MIKKKVAEFRTLPTDEKGLVEQREDLAKEMRDIVEGAKAETRTLTDAEETRFNEIKEKIDKIDTTLKAFDEQRSLEDFKPSDNKKDNKEDIEERAFANYIRGVVEERADVNLTATDNGAVIPKSIANKIIKKVSDISPIYQLATRYNVGGNLTIPYYDESTSSITTAYATEFTDLESTSGKFLNIELKGYLAGALSKISRSLLNNSNFNLVSFVINEMSDSIAKFIKREKSILIDMCRRKTTFFS